MLDEDEPDEEDPEDEDPDDGVVVVLAIELPR
jgi:hypothetical protein